MTVGVIEIGEHATRVLVAEVDGRVVTPVVSRRWTGLPGRGGWRRDDAEIVEADIAFCHEAGAEDVVVCAGRDLRGTPGERMLRLGCHRFSNARVELISPSDAAVLAFKGATAVGDASPGPVAVVDLGAESTKLAVGEPGGEPTWRGTRAIGAERLNGRALLSDPPKTAQLAAARNAVGRRLMRLSPPPAERTIVASTSSPLELVCGADPGRQEITDAISALSATGVGGIASDLGVEPDIVQTIPAELLVLEALCDLVPEPLTLAAAGLLEGVALASAGRHAAAGGGTA